MDSIPFEKVKSTFKNRYLNIAIELGDDAKVLDYLFDELATANASCIALQTKVQTLEDNQKTYQGHIAKLLEQLGMKKEWWRPWKK